MTRRAFAGKQELTSLPTRLDQCSNLSPCLPRGPYAFLAKSNQFYVVHATRPCRRAEKTGNGRMSKGRRLCNKKPGKCRAFQFSVNFILLNICEPHIRGQHRLGRRFFNCRLKTFQ
jgi:hypothetical protein